MKYTMCTSNDDTATKAGGGLITFCMLENIISFLSSTHFFHITSFRNTMTNWVQRFQQTTPIAKSEGECILAPDEKLSTLGKYPNWLSVLAFSIGHFRIFF